MSETNNRFDEARRAFFGKASAAAAMTVAPGVFLTAPARAKPADETISDARRWGILIDTQKCASGCTDCVGACEEENAWGSASESEKHSSPEQKARWIRKVNLKEKSTGHVVTLPLMCQHCETPPCADVCPTGASFKRADGIVLVDKHICIGCRYCMMACPYKARSFVHEDLKDQMPWAPRGKGTVESCTLCVHRIDNDRMPACVEVCTAENHNAMVFGDLNDENSDISQQLRNFGGDEIRADLGLNTGVRYRGL